MAEVIIADSAWEDLSDIADFISKDSPRYAAEYTDRLLDRAAQIATHPDSGRMVPEFNSPIIRELIYGSYRIVYSTEDVDVVVVLRFIHAARRFP
jgi:toxin ParE1/3/4